MENTLGAPTQGLGQTVTFTRQASAPPSLQLAAASAPSGQQAGGQATSLTSRLGGVPEVAPDPTMAFLVKAGQELLRPKIEEARTQRFVEGMARAQAGATVLEIASERPWYARLFGDGDAVAGARAYTQQTRAQETANALSAKMTELRQEPPEAFAQVLSGAVKNMLTGDAATDAHLLQSFARVSPALVAEHTREHIKYTQGRAVEAFSGALTTGAETVGRSITQLAKDDAHPDIIEVEGARLLSLAARPEGMPSAVHQGTVAAAIMEAAEAGNFHAVNAMAPAAELLPPALRARVLRSIDINQRQALSHPRNAEYQERLDDLIERSRTVPPDTPPDDIARIQAELSQEADSLNARFMRETGNKFPIFDSRMYRGTRLSLAAAANAYRRAHAEEAHREALAAAKEAGERDGKEVRMGSIVSRIRDGQVHVLQTGADRTTPDEEAEAVTRMVGKTLTTAGPLTPAAVRDFKAVVNSAVVGPGREALRAFIGAQFNAAAGSLGPQFNLLYDNYLRVKDANPEALGSLFSDYQLKRLALFETLYPRPTSSPTSGPEDAAARADAFISAMKEPLDPRTPNLSQAAEEEAAGHIKSQVTSLFFGHSLSEVHQQTLMRNLRPHIEVLAPRLGVKGAASAALGAFKRNGGVIAGPLAWRDSSTAGKGMHDIFSEGDKSLVFGADADSIGDGVEKFVEKALEDRAFTQYGAKVETTDVLPLGGGRLLLRPRADDGTILPPIAVRYRDIGMFMHDERKREVEAAAQPSKVFGGNYYTPDNYKRGLEIVQEEFKRKQGN